MNISVFIQEQVLFKRQYRLLFGQLNKRKRCIPTPNLAICFYNTIIYKKNSCICITLCITAFFSEPLGHLIRQRADSIPVTVRVYQIYAVIFRFTIISK